MQIIPLGDVDGIGYIGDKVRETSEVVKLKAGHLATDDWWKMLGYPEPKYGVVTTEVCVAFMSVSMTAWTVCLSRGLEAHAAFTLLGPTAITSHPHAHTHQPDDPLAHTHAHTRRQKHPHTCRWAGS